MNKSWFTFVCLVILTSVVVLIFYIDETNGARSTTRRSVRTTTRRRATTTRRRAVTTTRRPVTTTRRHTTTTRRHTTTTKRHTTTRHNTFPPHTTQYHPITTQHYTPYPPFTTRNTRRTTKTTTHRTTRRTTPTTRTTTTTPPTTPSWILPREPLIGRQNRTSVFSTPPQPPGVYLPHNTPRNVTQIFAPHPPPPNVVYPSTVQHVVQPYPVYQPVPISHSGSGIQGSHVASFLGGYLIGRITSGDHSHHQHQFWNDERHINPVHTRYEHYTVHHYYDNRDSVPRRADIGEDTFVSCGLNVTELCSPHTYPMCLRNGTIMCVTSLAYTVPCENNSAYSCAVTILPCDGMNPACQNNQVSIPLGVPCISNLTVTQNSHVQSHETKYCVTAIARPPTNIFFPQPLPPGVILQEPNSTNLGGYLISANQNYRHPVFDVIHYYYNNGVVPPVFSLKPDEIIPCRENFTTLCVPYTYSMCLKNGSVLCESNPDFTRPCEFMNSMACINTIFPCIAGSFNCTPGQASASVSLPCISTLTIDYPTVAEKHCITAIGNPRLTVVQYPVYEPQSELQNSVKQYLLGRTADFESVDKVYHYYLNRDGVPKSFNLSEDVFKICDVSISRICSPFTYPFCLTNGTIICASDKTYTSPCSTIANTSCTNTVFPCRQGIRYCTGDQTSFPLSVPCISNLKIVPKNQTGDFQKEYCVTALTHPPKYQIYKPVPYLQQKLSEYLVGKVGRYNNIFERPFVVHNYYNNLRSVPRRFQIHEEKLAGCRDFISKVCMPYTTPLCLQNGTIMCTTNSEYTVPCEANTTQKTCAITTMSCENGNPLCEPNKVKTSLLLPCILQATVFYREGSRSQRLCISAYANPISEAKRNYIIDSQLPKPPSSVSIAASVLGEVGRYAINQQLHAFSADITTLSPEKMNH